MSNKRHFLICIALWGWLIVLSINEAQAQVRLKASHFLDNLKIDKIGF